MIATRIGSVSLLALTFVGCRPVTHVAPNSQFTMAVGQLVRIAGSDITLRFTEVENDSRCAVDVVCVHAGSATVHLEAKDASGRQWSLVVNSDREPRAADVRDYTILLTGLTPAPRSTERIRPEDYRARLELTRPENPR